MRRPKKAGACWPVLSLRGVGCGFCREKVLSYKDWQLFRIVIPHGGAPAVVLNTNRYYVSSTYSLPAGEGHQGFHTCYLV